MYEKAKALIREFEGLRLEAYRCPAGVLTIGYGHTEGVKEGEVITEVEAEQLLDSDTNKVAKQVKSVVTVPLTDSQLDALIDFTFNLGIGNLKSSTLLKKLNAGDYAGTAEEFNKWIYSGKAVLPGLVRRREIEKQLFLSAN